MMFLSLAGNRRGDDDGFGVLGHLAQPSAETEEAEDGEDHYDQADEIDDAVHCGTLHDAFHSSHRIAIQTFGCDGAQILRRLLERYPFGEVLGSASIMS
jgi:hypothetical protein